MSGKSTDNNPMNNYFEYSYWTIDQSFKERAPTVNLKD